MRVVAVGFAILSAARPHELLVVAAEPVVHAIGMVFTTAPSTGAIMQSLRSRRSGVGSAVNDTTREVGGALGGRRLRAPRPSRFHSFISQSGGAGRSSERPLRLGAAGRPGRFPFARGVAVAQIKKKEKTQPPQHARPRTSAASATLVIAITLRGRASGIISCLLRPTRAVRRAGSGAVVASRRNFQTGGDTARYTERDDIELVRGVAGAR